VASNLKEYQFIGINYDLHTPATQPLAIRLARQPSVATP